MKIKCIDLQLKDNTGMLTDSDDIPSIIILEIKSCCGSLVLKRVNPKESEARLKLQKELFTFKQVRFYMN